MRGGTRHKGSLRGIAGLCMGLLLCSGCSPLDYYRQAVVGQCRIVFGGEPIEELLKNPKTPAWLTAKLEMIEQLRRFAATELLMEVGERYTQYVDLEKPYVVWNVFAASEFSLKLKNWCYPIVGCFSYRGYFKEKEARNAAAHLQKQGMDVYVGGVSAYSTLGWFDDPVLNTFVRRSEIGLAGLIFHELAHDTVFVNDDTVFNESFATAIETEGVLRWLRANGKQEAFAAFLEQQEEHDRFVALVKTYRQKLQQLYAANQLRADKRLKKAALFKRLREAYQTLKASHKGVSGYEGWFASGLNNAKLLTVGTYHDFTPSFLKRLKARNGDLKAFYRECRDLAQLSRKERHRVLEDWNP